MEPDIRELFDGIAPRYDFLNRLLSFGLDIWWRKRAAALLEVKPGERILDMATGTADVALEIARRYPAAGMIAAADFSLEMLKLGKEKIARAGQTGRIFPVVASCEQMPFPDRVFAGAIIAFGIRNVADRQAGLRELHRVLCPGGRLVVLEFSTPRQPLFRALYLFYLQRFLPWVAGLFSRRAAYRYLPRSVVGFPDADRFRMLMEEAGFRDIQQTEMTFGIVTLHIGFRTAL